MEIETNHNDEAPKPAKRSGTQHGKYYNQTVAFGIIGVMFLLLTLFTSDETFGVFPVRWFFYFGSMAIGIALFGFSLLLSIAWNYDNIPIPMPLFYTAAGLILCITLTFSGFIGIAGSWILGVLYFMRMGNIPADIFPLLLALTIGIAIVCAIRNLTVPRSILEILAYAIILFSAVYIWGRAIIFESDFYDEGLEVAGTTYHTIVYYGWLGDPGLVYLYACDTGYFGCELIYETPERGQYRIDETQLVYDEAAGAVRLEYYMSETNAQYRDIPSVLYTMPVP